MTERFKKCISLLLTFSLILCSAPVSGLYNILPGSFFARAQSFDGFSYEIDGGKAVITGCSDDKQGEVTVPASFGGFEVSEIAPAAFCRCTGITGVTLPSSVKKIGDYAFFYCSSLENIYISSAPDYIGDYAFSNCKELKSADLPDGTGYIGAYAFENCSSLVSFRFPQGPDAVMEGTFFNCGSLISAEISPGAGAIGKQAFYRCSSLCDMLLPEGLNEIGESAFGSCLSLPGLYIPETVSLIGSNAFANCRLLTSVDLPDGIRSISAYTFDDCLSLSSVSIPYSVIEIGEGAFKGCLSLDGVVLPDSISVINKSTFENCESLTQISLPQNVTKIDNYAFSRCCSLSDIVLPSSLKTLGIQAFYGCVSVDEITLPASLIDYGSGAFAGCEGLSGFETENGSTKYTVDGGVLYSASMTIIVQYPAGKTDAEFTFPASVTGTKDYAFSGCRYLKSVIMTDAVTSIGTSAFSGCVNLLNVRLSSSLQTIGYMAFSKCVRLPEIKIPNVMSVYNYAFSECISLRVVYVGMSSPVNIYQYAFMYDSIDHMFYSAQSPNSRIAAEYVHCGASVNDYTLVSSNDPTTSAAGSYVYSCGKCGGNISVQIPAADKKITVSFDSAGGSVAAGKTVEVSGCYGALPVPVKEDHVFLGWFTALSGGERISAGSLVSEDTDVLYAHWAKKNVEVTFSSGDTPCGYKKKTVVYGGTAGILPVLEKPGYTFAGWYTSPENGNRVLSDSTVCVPNDFTLYAQWAGAQGKVYFDNNYDSCRVNLLEITTKSLSQDSFDYAYDAQSGIISLNGSLTENTVLAQMPFNVAEGEIYIISTDVVSGSVSGGCVVAEGFERADQSERFELDIVSDCEKTLTVTADQASSVNCLQVWIWVNRSQSNSIEFNDFCLRLKVEKADSALQNATAPSPNRITVQNGGEYGPLPVPASRYGYNFAGWADSAENGNPVTAQSVAAVPGEQTLYAQWTPVENDVYFDVNHDGIGVNLFAPEKGTQVNGGVSYSFDHSTNIITFNGSYTQDTVLYYKPFKMKEGEVYALKSEYISGSYSGGVVTFEAMDNAENSRRYFDLRNYSDQTVWTVSAEREKSVYCVRLRAWHSSSADVSYLNNFKIRLKFEKIADESSGPTEFSPAAAKIGYMQNYSALPVPEREGYNFDGWYTSAQGGTRINEESICDSLGDKTLYARWSDASYYTYFDLNYGSIRPNLFGLSKTSASSNGITVDYDRQDGTLTYNGTAQSTAIVFRQPMTLSKGAKLRMSGIYESGTLSGGRAYVEMYFSDTDYSQVIKFYFPQSGSTTDVWEIPKSGTFLLNVNFYGTGQTADNFKVKLKIEKVSSSSDEATGFSPCASYTKYGNQIGELPAAVKAGKHFDGWFTLPEGGEKVESSFTVKKQQTLYAHWSDFVLRSQTASIDYVNGYIFGIRQGTDSLDGIFSLNCAGCSLEYEGISPRVKTGSVVNVIKDGQIYESYKIIIAGDVNSDGFADGEDAVLADCIAEGFYTDPQIETALAADVDSNGAVNKTDVALLERSGLKL